MTSAEFEASREDRAGLRTRVRDRVVPAAWFAWKRAIDIVVSVVALCVTAPILLLAMVGIMFVSPGSPFFVQERVGLNGKRFRLIKLRSMVLGAHHRHEEMIKHSEVRGPVLKIKDDPRFHLLGKVLRRTSIDELPNFLNVLLGDLSVVGPRPPLPIEVAAYTPYQLQRLAMKPGITCLWQISGRSTVAFSDWVELDLHYIANWTPLGDLLIILKTIPAVLRGTGAH